MASASLASIEGVCEVTDLGDRSRPYDLLLEVPHGATRAVHFDLLRRQLRGPLPADLRAFFFVNTDVGAPEVAASIAARVVAAAPRRRVLVVRSLIPRTFVDCNRVIDEEAVPAPSGAGEPTPGLPAYVGDASDRQLLLERYAAYRRLATEAYARVCGQGGVALMLHTYAPRSIDVPVDERVVERLRAEYAPGRLEHWPLRPDVDLIARDPSGNELASPGLVAACRARLTAAGYRVETCGTYTLHPSTLAHAFATAHAGRTLCLELRRDLLVGAFTPFAEMVPEPGCVDRAGAALALAVATLDA